MTDRSTDFLSCLGNGKTLIEIENEEEPEPTKPKYTCPHCPEQFRWAYTLRQHIKDKHNHKKFVRFKK